MIRVSDGSCPRKKNGVSLARGFDAERITIFIGHQVMSASRARRNDGRNQRAGQIPRGQDLSNDNAMQPSQANV